jgi:NAD(P)-dependent dehydrogenase (short-subunit alcohol dehydrogenase family)
MFNPLDLTDRRYLITGAASGIGKATSIVLSELGAKLLLADINEGGLIRTKDLTRQDDELLIIDLTEIKNIYATIKSRVTEFGKLNGFVHCAGIPYISPLNSVNPEKSELLFKLNSYAAIELAKVCSNKQVYAGENGSFVLISSVYGLVGSAANVVYAMSKSALIGITKSLAIELSPKNIRVNCVAPGFVKTSMMDENSGKFSDSYLDKLSGMHPLGLGDAKSIAEPIAFLLSDASRWITGIVLSVDGGYTAQ